MPIEQYLMTFYSTFLDIFTRLFGLFIAMPLIGAGLLPLRVRMTLALVMSLMLVSSLPSVSYQNFPEMFISVISSFFTGVTLGLIMQIPFQAFITGGQIMAYQMGLGFAMVVDPITGVNTPSLSQFYFLLMAFTFLHFDIHLALMRLIIESFEVHYAQALFDPQNMKTLARHFAEIFDFGLQIALSTVFVMLITNMALALMTKAAPAINIFSIGFPLMIVTGVALTYLTFFSIAPQAVDILDKTLELIEI